MPRSVLDAIRQGEWNFEPLRDSDPNQQSTAAMPGTPQKLDVLADRLRQGLPLWHPHDRLSYDDTEGK